MTTREELKPGTQILSVPNHAYGDEDHPDVEAGFVTSVREDAAFCRYWSKYHTDMLRTMANSELTPLTNLVIKNTVAQELVDLWFAEQP